MCGINPDYDYLFDPQQRDLEHFPVCGCCRHLIYAGEMFWTLNRITEEIIVCKHCKTEMENSVSTVVEVQYG